MNYPYVLVVTHEGDVEVSIREADPSLRSIYRLTRFGVQSVAMSDRYWDTHKRLELDRTITHSSEACPERLNGKTVKVWQPETGWKAVTAPQAFPPLANGHGK